ncbi:MAG: hypothetical protein PVG39_29060 [Desulfobacteraceae bacterium]|jgi:hypothetical protein
MKLYAVSVRTKLFAVLSIVAFIMIAVVSSAGLTGKRLNKVNDHFKNDGLKVQGVTTVQRASKAVDLNAVSSKKPKMPTEKVVLYTLVAAATVIGGEFEINDPNDDAPSSSGNNNNGF